MNLRILASQFDVELAVVAVHLGHAFLQIAPATAGLFAVVLMLSRIERRHHAQNLHRVRCATSFHVAIAPAA